MSKKFYTKEHEWVELLNENEAVVGITDYAQGELGEIVFVDVQTVGETLSQMDVFGSIEAVKTVADLHLPIGGDIVSLNEQIEEHPELINQSAESNGWIVKVHYSNANEVESLMTNEQYVEYVKSI